MHRLHRWLACIVRTEVLWQSGVVLLESELEGEFHSRGMQVALTPTLLLGVRDESGTLSVISPRVRWPRRARPPCSILALGAPRHALSRARRTQGEPAFSFAAPHDLRPMNRTGRDHHHIGDITLRARRVPLARLGSGSDAGDATTAYQRVSTVRLPQWGVKQPPPPRAM